MKSATRSVTIVAALVALCAVTGLFPFVFFLPVIVAATTLSVGIAAFVGFAFGCISIVYSFILPVPSFAALGFMRAPYIAVVPRIFAAVGAYFVHYVIVRAFAPETRRGKFAAIAAAAATGSLLNTALVVSLFVTTLPTLELGGITMLVAAPEMLVSGCAECVCVAALAPPIVLAIERALPTIARRGSLNGNIKSHFDEG